MNNRIVFSDAQKEIISDCLFAGFPKINPAEYPLSTFFTSLEEITNDYEIILTDFKKQNEQPKPLDNNKKPKDISVNLKKLNKTTPFILDHQKKRHLWQLVFVRF